MTPGDLDATASALVAEPRGILAIDESVPTITSRFEALGIRSTAESRRDYRELLVTTPPLALSISGAILHDETIRQTASDGTAFPQLLQQCGILPGIKVDTGAHPLAGCPGEKVTEGLDGLRDRLSEYREMGAAFAKWRGVLTIGPGRPSTASVAANAHALARYAALCQEAGLVPIVEPEVLMDGEHGIEECAIVTARVQEMVFRALAEQGVSLTAIVLKPNMVLPGAGAPRRSDVDHVADATVACLLRTVPPAVPGVAFLSGGQGTDLATAHLAAIAARGPHPWQVTFSYGRALQDRALASWRGELSNVPAAQRSLSDAAAQNAAARVARSIEPAPA